MYIRYSSCNNNTLRCVCPSLTLPYLPTHTSRFQFDKHNKDAFYSSYTKQDCPEHVTPKILITSHSYYIIRSRIWKLYQEAGCKVAFSKEMYSSIRNCNVLTTLT